MLTDGIDDQHISCYGYPTGQPLRAPPSDKGGELVRVAASAAATAKQYSRLKQRVGPISSLAH